jgi:hypothetical protein
LGAERVYVLSTGIACDLTEPPHGALGMLLHSMSLLLMRRLQVEVELLANRAELIVLPPPCPPGASPIDFSRSDDLVRRGLEASRRFLDELESGRIEDPALGLDPAASMPVFSRHELHRERLASPSRPASGFARSRRASSLNGTCHQDPEPRPPQVEQLELTRQ